MRLKICLILILFLFSKVCFGALDAAITWEIHTTGESSSASMNNGGGFKAGASGTDYSQGGSLPANGAPHLAFTDLETKNADYDRVYSATHNASLVAGCIGNVIHIISGTNFTAGWYEVTGNGDGGGDGLYLDIDRVCASANSNNAIANLGGALALNSALDDDFFEALTAGNTVYISGGGTGATHSFGEDVNVTNDGTALLPITIEGYDSSRGDNPTTTSRPTIAAAAQYFYVDDYWIRRNLIVTSTHNYGVLVGGTSVVENCKSTNSSGSAYSAFEIRGGDRLVNCEAISTNGNAIKTATYAKAMSIFNCYIHDSSVRGIYIITDTESVTIINNIIDTCGIGIYLDPGEKDFWIINNTFYNCTTGIDAQDCYNLVVLNNLFDECLTPASQSTEQKNNWWDYNSWDGDKSSNSNVTEGDNSIDSDITLTNPANGDFTLGSGSACLDAGIQVGTNTGAVGDYKWNIGADQDDVAAAGAGGGRGARFIIQ